MKLQVEPPWGLLRAARRFVLVVGAGALGAVVCSTGVSLFVPTASEVPTGRVAGRYPAVGPARPIGTSERRALDLLRRAGRAQTEVGYRGRKVFGSWSRWGRTTTAAFVTNAPAHGTSVVAQPGGHAIQLLSTDGRLDDAALATLAAGYRLRVSGADTMLGRPVTLVEVARVSGVVVGRFWLDDASGLLLRRDLADASGVIVRRTAFTQLTVDAVPAATTVATPTPAPTADGGCAGGLSATDLDALLHQGWDLPTALPAGLALVCARLVALDGVKAVQLSYSDGLFALSLFAQPGELSGAVPSGFTARQIGGATVHLRCGLYREISWAGDDTVYTMVTDAPDATVTSVVAALPTGPRDAGFLARVSRGIERMGSWVDPFH